MLAPGVGSPFSNRGADKTSIRVGRPCRSEGQTNQVTKPTEGCSQISVQTRKIQCDASSTGLGSTLMQEGKPLAYVSRAHSTTEVGYAQIENECLDIVFWLERFHQYTFGRKTIVNTDHKPLETIVKNHCVRMECQTKA